MVKKWIVIMIVFVLLIVSCILENFYITNSFNRLDEKLVIAKQMLEEDDGAIDNEENIKYLKSIENDWDKNIKGLKSVIWHTGLKEIEIGLSRVITYTEENNFTEAMTELNAVRDYLDTYEDEFKLSLENLAKKDLCLT